MTLTNPLDRDTDDDWFSDGQEVLESGVTGVNLKALGANPLVRDIFVEIDYMAEPAGLGESASDTMQSAFALPVRKAALDQVKAVFDAYVPDSNDGAAKPIKIDFDIGNLYSGSSAIDAAQYNLGGGEENNTDTLGDHDDWRNLALRVHEAMQTDWNGISRVAGQSPSAAVDDHQNLSEPCLHRPFH